MTHILFWLYVGGALGQASVAVTNSDVSRNVKRSFHWFGVRGLLIMLLGLALWPLLTVLLAVFDGWFERWLRKMQHARGIEVRCGICGLTDEAVVSHGRFFQDPPHWYSDKQNPEMSFCSYRCATHFAQHHAHETPE